MKKNFVKTIIMAVVFTIIMQTASFAKKQNVFDIFNAYENLNEMTLQEFCGAVVRYFGLNYIEPNENSFVEENVDEDILRLVKLQCIFGYEDGTVRPNEVLGVNRASVILGRVNNALKDLDEENSNYVFMPTDVNPKMQNAEYWTSRIKNANEVLLSKEDIVKMNEEISKTKETYMYHLDNFPEKIDGVKIKEELSSFTTPTGRYYMGKETDEAFWKKIRANISGSKDGKNTPIRYGIITTHTVIKQFPFEEMISDDPGDPEWDQCAITGLNINEPVLTYITTKDKKYTYVKGRVSEGWVKTDCIAVCKDKDEWHKAQNPQQFLVVTCDRLLLEPNAVETELSKKTVNFGTKLELVTDYDGSQMIMNRVPYSNYIVNFPMRSEKGEYYTVKLPIPKNRGVNVGYLDFTRANIITLAFNCLGDHYGWGGMMESMDCSEFARHIYECMGVFLPRNTTWQASVPYGVTKFDGISDEEKTKILDSVNAGSIIQFKGHEMIYLGKVDGKYYTINSVSSIKEGEEKKRIRTVLVNSLDTMRANGNTWFQDLNTVIDIAG